MQKQIKLGRKFNLLLYTFSKNEDLCKQRDVIGFYTYMFYQSEQCVYTLNVNPLKQFKQTYCRKHGRRILLSKPLQRNTRNTEEHTVGLLEIFTLVSAQQRQKYGKFACKLVLNYLNYCYLLVFPTKEKHAFLPQVSTVSVNISSEDNIYSVCVEGR